MNAENLAAHCFISSVVIGALRSLSLGVVDIHIFTFVSTFN
jgi:hypothetical protein